ncbi:aminotransferase class V-fold PLP-dependent enzyme, partial [Candidatus Pacebacteria bacterium]|nr:aminotransferase class V-fold PLP-dependent enzyme [Candidatus Paceibacterota bacterium]
MFNFLKKDKTNKRIYLDYAAATPTRKEVVTAMEPYFGDVFGNAGAVHKEGVAASRAVEDSRAQIAKLLGIRKDDITFTSGGTESNNLAIYGTLRALNSAGKSFSDIEIISTKVEHPSTLRALEHMSEIGVTVLYVDVNGEGLIEEKKLKELLSENTALVTFAYA